MNFKHILFPVDLSEQCRRAAPFVAATARQFGAEVEMLYVLELPPTWYGTPDGPWGAPLDVDQLRSKTAADLNGFAPDVFAGITVTRSLVEGDASQQILCASRKNKSDLIMMPTHGYGPYRSLLLGSVTAKVLHDAECPVWTGVHTSEFSAHAPAPIRLIFCCIDTDSKDLRVILWANQFAQSLGAEVRLVHVIPGKPGGYEHAERTYHELLHKNAREFIDKMQSDAGTNLKVVQRLGTVEQAIHDTAQDENADLIVLGRGVIQKPLGRLRSNAYAIIRRAPCPVISV